MRRHKHEDHVNHEAWAIPYADLMTLLLAFFVVMYAVSVVNEGKFRVMSESLIEAFNGSSHVIAPLPPTQVRPHNVTPSIAKPAGTAGSIVPIAMPIPPQARARDSDKHSKASAPHNLGEIEHQVRKALQPLIDRKLVIVRQTPDWLEIEIRTDILFPSGVAQLSESADQVLQDLADVLARFHNPLRVEGFTDDVPINTPLYPSNWELSAARAARVARLFSTGGIAPERLGIIGWGEIRPIGDNTTAEGRNQNRRVLVVVMSDRLTPGRELRTPENLRGTSGMATIPVTPANVLPTMSVRASDRNTDTPDNGAAAPTVEAATTLAPPVVARTPAATTPEVAVSRRASP